MAKYIFERTEKKYMLTEEQYKALTSATSPLLEHDKYDTYTICNVYYDSHDNDLIRRSIEKPVFKEKLRIRSYGIPTRADTVFVEIKKKFDGIVYKRRTKMSLAAAEAFLSGKQTDEGDAQVKREIEYLRKREKLRPHIYIAYDRCAFRDREGDDLRVTFDRNIRTRDTELSLSAGDYGTPLLDAGLCIMEIKSKTAMPLWLTAILDELEIYPCPFSKVGTAYRLKAEKTKNNSLKEEKFSHA